MSCARFGGNGGGIVSSARGADVEGIGHASSGDGEDVFFFFVVNVVGMLRMFVVNVVGMVRMFVVHVVGMVRMFVVHVVGMVRMIVVHLVKLLAELTYPSVLVTLLATP